MRKDGIQTRKRKPKKAGSGPDLMGMVKKEDMIHHHHHHEDLKSSISDRNGNSKLMLPGSPKLLHNAPKTHISPIHSHHNHHSSQSSYPLTSPLSSMHSSNVNSPSKYDLQSPSSSASSLNHSATVSSHLYTSPLISSTQSNLHNSYLHNNNLATSYGAIKSESSIPGITNPIGANYDYMSNCIQNGYFAGSFGSAPPDLSGYHHQHNVIQASKLMASS